MGTRRLSTSWIFLISLLVRQRLWSREKLFKITVLSALSPKACGVLRVRIGRGSQEMAFILHCLV